MGAEVISPPQFQSLEVVDSNRLGFPHEYKEYLEPAERINHQVSLNLINTRLFMNEVSRNEGRNVTIDEITTRQWLEKLKNYDIAWFMGIYAIGDLSREHARGYEWEYRHALPDLDPESDISGSPYAMSEYIPSPNIARDWKAWDKMVEKIHSLDKKVFVDFVPNHVGIDHPWAKIHPEYFIQGTTQQYLENPLMYQVYTGEDDNIYYLAHGKDPNHFQWLDNLQLNYANPQVQEEMEDLLLELVEHSDGVRCDLTMLINANTFIRTWGDFLTEDQKNYIQENNFWEKVIPKAKEKARRIGKDEFDFVAEAYWDEENIGKYFDYVYDSDLYKKLIEVIINDQSPSSDLLPHIKYLMSKQRNYRRVNYTENHDEERSIIKLGENPSKAAAVLTGLLPDSIFLVHEGQETGSRIRPPAQISRKPLETPDKDMELFYERLLSLKRSKLFQDGEWSVANIDTQNENLITYQVSLKSDKKNSEEEIGAFICINLGRHTASGRIPEIEKNVDATVYRLTKGDIVLNPDLERSGGIYMELLSWETQILFYKK